MSNYSDFDESPPPSPPPGEDFDEDYPPPEDEDPVSDNEMSLPPPSDDDFDGARESFEDDDFPPPSEDMDDDRNLPSPFQSDELSPPPSSMGDPPESEIMSTDNESLVRKDGLFILPVKALQSVVRNTNITVPQVDSDLESLSTGLAIKSIPPIVKSFVSVPGPPHNAKHSILEPSVVEAKPLDLPSKKLSVTSIRDDTSVSVVKDEFSLQEGYLQCMGKFEGDPFEKLQVRLVGTDLFVRVGTGEVIDFNLAEKSFAFEDIAEPRTLILDYRKTPIVLKFFSDDEYVEFMKALPEVVFIAQDSMEDVVEQSVVPIKEKKRVSTNPVSRLDVKPNPKLQSQHVKGTSVEDLLENDMEEVSNFKPAVNASAMPLNQIVVPVGPPRKKELADSHIRRPKYSVRRVSLLCEWINTLHIWPNKVSILTLHKEMVNGVLLAKLVKVLNPEVQFVHLNEKALAKKAAVENLEQALGHIWRSKSLNNSRIPSAEDIYNGDTSKIAILLNELFGVYVQRPLFKLAVKILRWFHNILKQYQRPLPSYVLDEGDLSGVWPHFQSGTALFCVLYHFFGTITVGSDGDERRLDPLRITGDPKSICDFRDNLRYVFDILHLIGVEVLWTPEDWITNPDSEFMLFQLSFIFERLKLQQCALPPAQGERPGLASGPNGEALVVGLVFNDTPSSLKFVSRQQKAVRLGYDADSMPLLPIDQPTQSKRFFSHGFLPRGMITKDVKLGFVGVKLKEAKQYLDKGQWNGRTTVRTEKESFEGHLVVDLLRSHHRRSGDKDDKEDSGKSQVSIRSNNFLPSTVRIGAFSGDPSQECKDRSVFSYEEYGKDITTLIKNLEEEMVSAQRDIQAAEDTLASRYIDLEASASSYSPGDYSIVLDQLENERVELENEKNRLKDYFSRKLSLIKERKEEAHKKAVDLRKATTTIVTNSDTPFASTSLQQKKKGLDESKRVAKSTTQKDVKQVEKGWIKLSSKMDTHNFHLRLKQEVASAAFQAKITPKHLLQKQSSAKYARAVNSFEASVSAFHDKDRQRIQMTAEEIVADSFLRFKDRLKVFSEKWTQSRNLKTRSVVQEIIQSGVKNPTVELISLPDKSVHTTSQGYVNLPVTSQPQMSAQLRMEELAAMYYEDERRKMVISEQEILRSLEQSQRLFVDTLQFTYDITACRPSSPVSTGKLNTSVHSLDGTELENILRFLTQPRVLTLLGRSPREYVFELVEHESNEKYSSNLDILMSFAWIWKDPYSSNDQGTVALADIDQVVPVAHDELALQLSIIESSRALKNSKGRTHLQLRCESQNERDKLVLAFSSIVYALHDSRK